VPRNFVYQLFCGRMPGANVLEHPGDVLTRMSGDFDWRAVVREGFDTVYLLGLWNTIGPVIVGEEQGVDIREFENRRPSPFAITDHTRPHPDLGNEEQLTQLVAEIKSYGLAVWADFVPNHTGLEHPWIKDQPGYYKSLDEKAFSGDVVELDYQNPQVGEAMTAVLKRLFDYGLDGLRCDMAHLVPVEFWQEAIAAVRQEFPQAVMTAEAYSDSVFDLTPQRGFWRPGLTRSMTNPCTAT
jgi:glycosidase